MTLERLKRRDFVGALVAGAALPASARADERQTGAAGPDVLSNKITLEEHFVLPSSFGTTFRPPGLSEAVWNMIEKKLLDVTAERLPQMDKNGIAMQVVSLSANGIQGETNRQQAIAHSRAANDWLKSRFIDAFPKRFAGFASVALQDPVGAAAEADRAVRDHGFKGVLVNGYVNSNSDDIGEYLDLPKFYPFWERTEALGVPVYLHPRAPLPGQRAIYEGHDELMGPMWAFGAETAAHALRLITSGLFDRYPRQQVILGHMGEGLVAMMARAQRRFEYAPCGKSLKKPLGQYLRDNFYITTSGNFHTPTLRNVIEEMGVDRVIFSIDYPYESMSEGADWFDQCPLAPADRQRIARENARQLLKLDV